MLEAEAVLLGVARMDDVVFVRIERADRDLVQQRLPDVGEVDVDQGDLRLLAPAQRVAKLGGEHEPTGAAADDDDVM